MQTRHLSEKCYSSREIASVDGVVIHHISAKNVTPDDPFNTDAIIRIFEDYRVSAHYLIERDGNILELVPDLRKAYHAGRSRMNGRDHCNSFTIGIELVGGANWPYTEEQVIACGELLARLMTEHQVTLEWIEGHDEVRAAWNEQYPDKRAARKVDPGDHFPWERLRVMLQGTSDAVENVS